MLVGALALGGVAYGAYHFLMSGKVEHTDNAYVQANVIQVTPAVGGMFFPLEPTIPIWFALDRCC